VKSVSSSAVNKAKAGGYQLEKYAFGSFYPTGIISLYFSSVV